MLVETSSMRRWRRNSQRLVALFLVASGLLGLGACSDSDSDEVAVPATEAPRTSAERPSAEATTTSAARSDNQLVDRYQGFWEARFRANQPPPNPKDPALEEFATGEQLTTVVAETSRNLADGLAVRRPADSQRRSRVRIVSLEGDVATLQECYVDDGIVFRPSTGEVVNDAVATHSVVATMQQIGGAWKVARTQLVQRWEGVAGCALAAVF